MEWQARSFYPWWRELVKKYAFQCPFVSTWSALKLWASDCYHQLSLTLVPFLFQKRWPTRDPERYIFFATPQGGDVPKQGMQLVGHKVEGAMAKRLFEKTALFELLLQRQSDQNVDDQQRLLCWSQNGHCTLSPLVSNVSLLTLVHIVPSHNNKAATAIH